MTRAEYLAELDSHLITLPKEERDMAVNFYEEYFEDAGPEQEQAVMEELGKPYRLARTIIGETSLYSKSEVYIKYKESKPMPQNSTGVFVSLQKPDAFTGQNADEEEDIMPERARNAQNRQNMQGMPASHDEGIKMYGANAESRDEHNENNRSNSGGDVNFDQYYTHAGESGGNYTPPPPPESEPASAGRIVFWTLMIMFVIIPIVIPCALCVFVVMIGIALMSVACFIGALIALVTGIVNLATSIPTGLGFIFTALLGAGIGFLLLSPTILFFGKALPWTFRKITGIFSKRRAA